MFRVPLVSAVLALLAPLATPQLPGGTLDPTAVPKYAEPLIIPPAMPRTARLRENRRSIRNNFV